MLEKSSGSVRAHSYIQSISYRNSRNSQFQPILDFYLLGFGTIAGIPFLLPSAPNEVKLVAWGLTLFVATLGGVSGIVFALGSLGPTLFLAVTFPRGFHVLEYLGLQGSPGFLGPITLIPSDALMLGCLLQALLAYTRLVREPRLLKDTHWQRRYVFMQITVLLAGLLALVGGLRGRQLGYSDTLRGVRFVLAMGGMLYGATVLAEEDKSLRLGRAVAVLFSVGWLVSVMLGRRGDGLLIVGLVVGGCYVLLSRFRLRLLVTLVVASLHILYQLFILDTGVVEILITLSILAAILAYHFQNRKVGYTVGALVIAAAVVMSLPLVTAIEFAASGNLPSSAIQPVSITTDSFSSYVQTKSLGRAMLWAGALSEIRRQPFSVAVGKPLFSYNLYSGSRAYYSFGTHSVPLEILVHFGLIGSIPFIGLLWLITHRLTAGWLNAKRKPPGVLIWKLYGFALVPTLLIHHLAIYGQVALFYWIAGGVVVAAEMR